MVKSIIRLFKRPVNRQYRPASIDEGLWASLFLGDGRLVDWRGVM